MGTLHSGTTEQIKVKVQQINGAGHSLLRLEEEGCVGRGCGMRLQKSAGQIIAVSGRSIALPAEYGSALPPAKFQQSLCQCSDWKQMSQVLTCSSFIQVLQKVLGNN